MPARGPPVEQSFVLRVSSLAGTCYGGPIVAISYPCSVNTASG